MIDRKVIDKKANQAGIPATQMEKDYILSWVLSGISQHAALPAILVFKGGTALKKIYFEHYRFSEDLDFTLVNPETDNETIFNWFEEVFQWVQEMTDIKMRRASFKEHQPTGSINFYIQFQGPLGGVDKEIKTDITRGEKLEFSPVKKKLIQGYDDMIPGELFCYPLEEVLIEKCCAMMGRMQPRDLYDIWYLLEEEGMKLPEVKTEFENKAKHKGLDPQKLTEKVDSRMVQYQRAWNMSLSAQIKSLPQFNDVERAVKKHLRQMGY